MSPALFYNNAGRLHLTRWAFDVEAVQLAQKLGVPLAEVAVRWREVRLLFYSILHLRLLLARDL